VVAINLNRLRNDLVLEGSAPLVTRTYVTEYNDYPFLKGIDAHYKVLNKKEYKQAMGILR